MPQVPPLSCETPHRPPNCFFASPRPLGLTAKHGFSNVTSTAHPRTEALEDRLPVPHSKPLVRLSNPSGAWPADSAPLHKSSILGSHLWSTSPWGTSPAIGTGFAPMPLLHRRPARGLTPSMS